MAGDPAEKQRDSNGECNGSNGGNRDPLGHFGKGNTSGFQSGKSGNPGGLVPNKSITADLNRIMAEGLRDPSGKLVNVKEAMARKAYAAALKGDFRFWNAIMERTEGKVREDVHVTTGLTMVLHPATPPPGWYERVGGLIGTEKGDPPIGVDTQ